MGCGGSKEDDLRLVTLCRERKDFVKAASNYRYALAAAHVSYFTALKDVGDALISFVDEETVIGASPSPPDSPVLTLPSDEGKKKKKKSSRKGSSSSSSISHSPSISHADPPENEQDRGSHLHLSSDSDSDPDSASGHIHIEEESSTVEEVPYYPPRRSPPYSNPPYDPYNPAYNPSYYPSDNPPPYYNPSYNPPPYDPYQQPSSWGAPGVSYTAYYMRRAPTRPTTVYEDPGASSSTRYWQDSSNVYQSYQQYLEGGFFGFPMGSAASQEPDPARQQSQQTPPPAPPAPEASTWDFINIFDTWEHTIPGYYSRSKYGSTSSSPDSKEIREREGIPDLEEETESEMNKELERGKNVRERVKSNLGTGASRTVPLQENDAMLSSGSLRYGERNKWTMPSPKIYEGSLRGRPRLHKEGPSEVLPSHINEEIQPAVEKEIRISPDTVPSLSPEQVYTRKREVTFDIDDSSAMPNSLSALSMHGTRDLKEAVKEIRDEFQTASEYGKEVALLLEVRKLPYQSRRSMLKLLLSRILHSIAASRSSSASASEQLLQLASRTREIAKTYCGDPGKDTNNNINSINISSVLDELYAWEKKLYKEVKNEERLRIIYEKGNKKLKLLADQGAEPSKIDAALASLKRLLTKINLHVRTIEAISRRINILRDNELQPQLKVLIDGLVRMWRSTLSCHQKQFQAILDSKKQMLKAKRGFRKDSSLRAAVKLEMELLNWSTHFSSWINAQKSYVKSLNGWLLRSLSHEQEETADGPIPFSPGRIGAPPIFVACNDWFQAMERISESRVTNSIHDFALNLHQLWEKQDEEQRQRIRSDYLIKDFERRVKTYRMQREKLEHHQDELSEKASGSRVLSGSGVSPVENPKIDLEPMRRRLVEERARQKEFMKQVSIAAATSIQAGLVPIFQSLGNFTSEALKAHELVRTEYVDNLQ